MACSIFLLLLLLLLPGERSVGQEVGQETTPESTWCGEQRLQKLLKEETELNSHSFRHPTNAAQLDAACRRLHKFQRRLWKYLDRCLKGQVDEETRRSLQRDKDLQGRLCTDRVFRQMYLRHAACIRRIRPHLANCSSTEQQEHLSQDHCCAMEAQRHCSRAHAQSFCGEEAAEYADQYWQVAHGAHLQDVCPSGCSSNSSMSSGACALAPLPRRSLFFWCALLVLQAVQQTRS